MTDETKKRLEAILQKRSAMDTDCKASEAAARESAKKTQRVKENAPTIWAEGWEVFDEVRKEINQELAPGRLQIAMADAGLGKKPSDLAMFQIFLIANGREMDSYMVCTVGEDGGLTMRRKLISLADTKHIPTDRLNRECLQDILLRFVENAQGMRPMGEIIRDYR